MIYYFDKKNYISYIHVLIITAREEIGGEGDDAKELVHLNRRKTIKKKEFGLDYL